MEEMDLTKRMVRYRAKNRLSQKAMAEQCGISLQTLCNVETGQQTPSRVTLEKILLVLEEDENGDCQHIKDKNI